MRTSLTPAARLLVLALLGAVAQFPVGAQAQPAADRAHVIVPPISPRHWPQRPQPVALSRVDVSIKIDEQVAATQFQFTLSNPSASRQEAELLLPVPDGVTVRSLELDGTGPEPTAQVLPKDEARRIYESIVRASRDPALVEFVGQSVIRTSAFPIPPNGTQKLRLTYEQVLPLDGQRVDYTLPRSEALADPGVPWSVSADISASRPIATIYSSSHDITTQRSGPGKIRVDLKGFESSRGSLRLSYLLDQSAEPLATTALLFPSADAGSDGGFFMLLMAPPAAKDDDLPRAKRDITLVLDRSGSMRGEKFEQARAAAVQVVRGIREGETFNIIDYSDSIAALGNVPLVKTPETLQSAEKYLAGLSPNGGTNIHDALLEALRPDPAKDAVPMVIFLTDGLPTVGERSEVKIRDAAKKANSEGRRIFSFGVGFDVNAPLLSNLATSSRGAATFVLPQEDVEVKVSQVFRRLEGPVMTEPTIVTSGGVLAEMQPSVLPDVFEGDQLVVLGQYRGSEPIRVTLQGKSRGKDLSTHVTLNPKDATVRHSFIPRIWATRKVAALVDQIRQMGAEGLAQDDPRMKELTEEIVRLSTRYGILTEYTAFLAREEVDFSAGMAPIAAPAAENFRRLAVEKRTGSAGVSQQADYAGKSQALNAQRSNRYASVDGDGQAKETNFDKQVSNLADRSYFLRKDRWVDGRLLDKETLAPDEEVAFLSERYFEVAGQLAREGRQAALAQGGDVLLELAGKRVLVKGQ